MFVKRVSLNLLTNSCNEGHFKDWNMSSARAGNPPSPVGVLKRPSCTLCKLKTKIFLTCKTNKKIYFKF